MSPSQSATGMVNPQYTAAMIVSNFFMAMTCENNIRGILLAARRIQEDPAAKLTPCVIIICNVLCMLTAISFVAGNATTTENNCVAVDLFMNLTYHMFMIAFDSFILYKTYLVTSKAKWFLWLAGFGICSRIFWSGADLLNSTGSYSERYGVCVWRQSPVTSEGYMASDIFCDLCATLTALAYCYKYFSTNVRKLFVVLATENVLRSLISLIITSVSMWLVTHRDPREVMYFTGVGVYLFAHLLNCEFYFFQARTSALTESHGAPSIEPLESVKSVESRSDTVRTAVLWASENEADARRTKGVSVTE
ncbi:hypothetical protein HDU98_001596 [Podochytrium sp. JEL0797]|nr:hypothetical protein HDU98_001596 [Podochytrium sp. JEL0797]